MSKILAFLLVVPAAASTQAQPYLLAKDSGNFFMGKQHDKALAYFKRSFEQGNTDLFDYYNAACAAALIQKSDEAFMLLDKAIDQGYMDKPWAEHDVDFNSLHDDSRWLQVLKKLSDQPRVMSQKLAAARGKDPATLIPFKQKGKWGYVDRKSLKVVVKPEFDGLTFMNGCAEVLCYDGTRLWINPSGELTDIVYRNHGKDMEFGAKVDAAEGPFPISSANGFRGFKMDENKRITQFSDIYNRVHPLLFNVRGPFLIDNKYYAIAEKGDAAGVIDEEGNSLPGFDFVHDQLALNSATTDGDTWFYYEDKIGKAGFINHKGKKKLEGELFNYPYNSFGLFDYGIQEGNNVFGVLDIPKMEWLIKPQPLHIRKIDGTTNAPCKSYTDDRKDMIDVYFLVIDNGAEPDEYYIDRKLKAYKPKH